MKRWLLISALAAAPLCLAHADGQSDFAARIEHYASGVSLSAQAVACHLRDAAWAKTTNQWLWAAGVIDEAELFPETDGTKQTAYMEARFDHASKQGSAAATPTNCAKLKASGQLDQLDQQINQAK